MNRFRTLNEKLAVKLLQKILLFTNKFPLKSENQDNEFIILSNIFDFYNIIHYCNTRNSKFDAKGNFGSKEKQEEIDIIDRSDIFIRKMINEFKKYLSINGINNLIELNNYFLNIKGVHLFHKTNVIDAENNIIKENLDKFIEFGNDYLINEFINIRLILVKDTIRNFDELIKSNYHFNQKEEALYNIYHLYLRYKTNYNIYRDKIFQAFDFLKNEFDENDNIKLKRILIQQLVNLNSRFLLEPMEIYSEIIEENSDLFSIEEKEIILSQNEPNPKAMEISHFKFSQGKIDKNIVEKNKIYTIIRFSIPFDVKDSKEDTIPLDKNIFIHFKQIENNLADPVFRLFKDLSIGSMGWNYFSDTFYSDNIKNTTIAFEIQYFYNPDMVLNEKGFIDRDFSDKTALLGREYYPHKEFIIQQLLQNSDKIISKLEISKADININLFSNYIVDYFDVTKNNIIYRRLNTITNPDSYHKATDKFLERLNELNLSNSFLSIRELIEKSNLTTDRGLSLFIQSLIDIIVKNNIELHSNFIYFWKTDQNGDIVPQTEPNMQPLIMGHLKTICDYMGIQISREVESANGRIDFLCSFTYNNKVLKTCVELKNAHNAKIIQGLTKQLPEYLKSERTRNGIYLVLWYKGDKFSKPNKYANIAELKTELKSLKVKGCKIDPIIIDCNKPIVPSKIK